MDSSKKTWLLRAVKLAAAIASGMLLAAAFPPDAQAIHAWFALAPLFLLIRANGPQAAAGYGWVTGLAFWCSTLAWLPAIIKNGGPGWLVVAGEITLSIVCSLFFAAFAAASSCAWRWAGKGPNLRRLAVILAADPLMWAGFEWLRANLFTGFAWNFLGVSQVENIPLLQIASIFGVYGVSALLVLVNESVATILARAAQPFIDRWNRAEPDKPRVFERLCLSSESFLPFLLIVLAWGWGLARERAWLAAASSAPTWRIAVIQPNIPCRFIDDPVLRHEQRLLLMQETELAGAAMPDLTLWSETLLPGYYPADARSVAKAREGAQAAHSPLLAGALEQRDDRVYNAAVLVDPSGRHLGGYRKQHLVPFGEYIPFDKTFPWLQRFAPTGESCTPGNNPGVMTLARSANPTNRTAAATLTIGPLICFEDTVSALSRAAVNAGARLLALITNDAWFDGSFEPLQHFNQSIFRAIENGVPLVRCANSGVSGSVSPIGRATPLTAEDGAVSDFHGFAVMPIPVPATPLSAPYTRFGDWLFALPGLFLAFLIVLASWRKSRRN